MKLNHLNLCVNDLTEARLFFEKIFDFKLLGQKGEAIAAMSDGEGFSLVLSSFSKPGAQQRPAYPKDFHLGFYRDTPEEVDAFYNLLLSSGISVEQGPKKIRNGYTLYFTALDGILFEVTSFAG
ncbi:glyoxalase [Paenibacillus chitinolyticus]|uniref:VOC family protein n=1 Tax=Paenibacillus chitinolyticus TaxID=79263 RepID=UPI0026E4C428|nr:VOC family protein [Paenibacillus chitinolyticus]GKS12645.1 glyoxalase [Paenibacillus chitinolyticus]